MVEDIRTLIYKVDLFFPTNYSGYSIDAFYSYSDELSEYSPTVLQDEINLMLSASFLSKKETDDITFYTATREGKIARQEHFAKKGILSKVLIGQSSYSLADLVLAILASDHVDPFSGSKYIAIDALSIYLHEFSEDSLNAVIEELKSSRFIAVDNLYFRKPFFITGRGLQKYKSDSRIRLNLGKREGILRLQKPVEKDARFSKLKIDIDLQDNLELRWQEMEKCVLSEAYLAAVILLGSIQEGALLAKLKMNMQATMTSNKAPKFKGTVKPIDDWTLAEYITVATDLGYTPKSVEKYLHELRDTRNLVHPAKQVKEQLVVDESLYRISREVAETVIDALSSS